MGVWGGGGVGGLKVPLVRPPEITITSNSLNHTFLHLTFHLGNEKFPIN